MEWWNGGVERQEAAAVEVRRSKAESDRLGREGWNKTAGGRGKGRSREKGAEGGEQRAEGRGQRADNEVHRP